VGSDSVITISTISAYSATTTELHPNDPSAQISVTLQAPKQGKVWQQKETIHTTEIQSKHQGRTSISIKSTLMIEQSSRDCNRNKAQQHSL
jgi:hypothetical protein